MGHHQVCALWALGGVGIERPGGALFVVPLSWVATQAVRIGAILVVGDDVRAVWKWIEVPCSYCVDRL